MASKPVAPSVPAPKPPNATNYDAMTLPERLRAIARDQLEREGLPPAPLAPKAAKPAATK